MHQIEHPQEMRRTPQNVKNLDVLDLARRGMFPVRDWDTPSPAIVHVENGKPLTELGARLLGVPWKGKP